MSKKFYSFFPFKHTFYKGAEHKLRGRVSETPVNLNCTWYECIYMYVCVVEGRGGEQSGIMILDMVEWDTVTRRGWCLNPKSGVTGRIYFMMKNKLLLWMYVQMSFLNQHDQSHVYYDIIQTRARRSFLNRRTSRLNQHTSRHRNRSDQTNKILRKTFSEEKNHTQKGSSDNSPLFCSNNDDTHKQSVSFLEKKCDHWASITHTLTSL